MTRSNRTIPFLAVPALLALFGCGSEPATGPGSVGGLASTVALAGLDPAASPFYELHNLASDVPGLAPVLDPALVNPWGLAASVSSPWWVADNATGLATLYDGNTGAKIALNVTVPGRPTGVIFNGGAGFVVTDGATSGPARFIFASEDGRIWGWSPGVPSPAPSTRAMPAVDNSAAGAVYKGLAVATTAAGDFLYAANFRAGRVDVFDNSFHPATLSGGFADPDLPAGYAPFGIQNLGGVIYVTYALQDADKEDDVSGAGHGFVNAFDVSGNLLSRVASRGRLNSPWGLAIAPADFGKFSGNLLVGNFGDGRINAFDLDDLRRTGELRWRGQLHEAGAGPVVIDGLWAIAFGNGAAAGPRNVLFFTAGPFAETHGLFGKLVAAAPHGPEP